MFRQTLEWLKSKFNCIWCAQKSYLLSMGFFHGLCPECHDEWRLLDTVAKEESDLIYENFHVQEELEVISN